MGRSDPYVAEAYKSIIREKKWKSIGFFGFAKPNNFTEWFESPIKDYYDLQKNNPND